MKRTTFYFDGFNFYYGLKEKSNEDESWKEFYWIDFVKFDIISNYLTFAIKFQ